MVGQADYAGAQANMACTFCGGGYKYFRRGNRLPPSAVVLTNVGFVETQGIQPLEQLQVSVKSKGGVFARAMERCQENPEFHSFGNLHAVLLD
jgi:hypothetical protein